jgi:hypothetical protein
MLIVVLRLSQKHRRRLAASRSRPERERHRSSPEVVASLLIMHDKNLTGVAPLPGDPRFVRHQVSVAYCKVSRSAIRDH